MRVNLNLALATVSIVATGAILWAVIRQGKTVAEAAGDVVAAVNPLNQDNVFAKAADKVTQIVTGDETTSLGSKIADLFDKSGQVATAPVEVKTGQIINIADYFKTVDRDDADIVPAPGFMDSAFFTNAGGAATGRASMKR